MLATKLFGIPHYEEKGPQDQSQNKKYTIQSDRASSWNRAILNMIAAIGCSAVTVFYKNNEKIQQGFAVAAFITGLVSIKNWIDIFYSKERRVEKIEKHEVSDQEVLSIRVEDWKALEKKLNDLLENDSPQKETETNNLKTMAIEEISLTHSCREILKTVPKQLTEDLEAENIKLKAKVKKLEEKNQWKNKEIRIIFNMVKQKDKDLYSKLVQQYKTDRKAQKK